ncbi:Disease resistance protein [Melia azedarach]|uniref:Disease resistance protein n=1 Tax=Melia azedarach TaxID=155640 RepID=A0ACC1Y3V4_MELAZ|nr:Disease resistance protein [Melia azedarach]
MDFVSPILDTVTRLWDCTNNHSSYVRHLRKNLKSLTSAKRNLENLNEDVKGKVEREEQQNCERTNVAKNWLVTVESKLEEVEIILQKGEEEIQKKCFRCCCTKNWYSNYKIGKKVIKKIDVVKSLIRQGKSLKELTSKLPRPPVDEMLVEKTVGMESILEDVWRCIIEDHGVRIIGLYGMGGMGKTTLLKKINNKFLGESLEIGDSRSVFDVVIWVVVSKEVDLEKIQEGIRKKLEISDEIWEYGNEDDRVSEISRKLRSKKFVLLLDDVWERIDLSKVGVPLDDQNGSKIIFTTRSEEVCGRMEAQKEFKVEGLSTEAALELFQLKVGEEVLNSDDEIPKLAEFVADECKGMPLALVTVGRAMARKKTPDEWRHAINMLQSYPSKFSDLWKMHDVIYDMALWLTSEEGNNILVAKSINLNKVKEIAKWKEAVRISLWGSNIEFHTEIPFCPRLQTLLVRESKLKTFQNNFFQATPALQVLDLSYNLHLTELPVGLGELINLQYLNLSDTNIKKVPIEIKNLRRLRMLLLDDMNNLEAIPSGVISCLSSLQAFSRLFGGSNELHYQHFDEITLLQELENLDDINEIGVTLFTLESITKFKSSAKLQSCFKGLTIKCSGLLSLDISCSVMRRMNNLEALVICDCDSLKEIKICFQEEESIQMGRLKTDAFRNLRDVRIWNCPLKDLTWLIYAPCLQNLVVETCLVLEEIIACDFETAAEISEEGSPKIFTKLRSMQFTSLRNLKSICRQAIQFVSLQSIWVEDCPSLRKLPLNSESAKKNLNVIYGSTEWWEQLEWEDEAIKLVFAPKFCL